MGKKSEVWKHFTEIDFKKARCKICQKQVEGSGNTTNYSIHLKRDHGIEVLMPQKKSTINRKRANIDTMVSSDSKVQLSECESIQESVASTLSIENITDLTKPKQLRIDETFSKQISFRNGPKANEINSKLVFMLAKDNMPFRTTEKEGFQEFVKSLNPHYKIPTRNSVTELTEEKYAYLSNIIKERLSKIENLCLTTDIWTETFNSKSYLGLTAHYIFGNECKLITIGVKELDKNHTSVNIEYWLLETCAEWYIKSENVAAVVSDNAANIKKAIIDAFGTRKHVPCFAHTLNLVPSKVIDSDPVVSPLIDKVKKLVRYFKQSVTAADELRKHTSYKLIQSVDTRWNSVYDMLQRFVDLADPISLTLLKFPTAPCMLSASELQTIKEFLSILKPFEEATKILCGESYVTVSKIIPVINILRQALLKFIPLTDIAKQLKNAIVEQFKHRFDNIEQVSVIAMATLLDPRFKKIHFMDRIACSRAIDKISKLLTETAGVAETSLNKGPTVINTSDQNKHDNFWSYHEELAKDTNASRAARDEGELFDELKYYLNQPTLDMKENPIKFWNSNSFSLLSTIAKQYLCIVATSVPSERLFSKAGRILSQDRSRLSGKHLHQLLFLASLDKEDWLFSNI